MINRFSLLLVSSLLFSCFNEADCILTYSNEIIINLKNATNGNPRSVLFNSITVEGTSLTSYENFTTTKLALPLNPSQNSIIFILNFEGRSESLQFVYLNKPVLITPDCGAYNFIQNLSVDETTFAEVRIINPTLLTSVLLNAEILL